MESEGRFQNLAEVFAYILHYNLWKRHGSKLPKTVGKILRQTEPGVLTIAEQTGGGQLLNKKNMETAKGNHCIALPKKCHGNLQILNKQAIESYDRVL